MAVIVVGDIEPAKAEEMIKKHFSALTSPASERKREEADVPAYKNSEAMVVTDRKQPITSFPSTIPQRRWSLHSAW